MTKIPKSIREEIVETGDFNKLPSASFVRNGYRYKRTTTGHAKHLITREHPRGRRLGRKITTKAFVRAWKRK